MQHIYRQYCILKKEVDNSKPNTKARYSNEFQSNVLRYYGNQKIDFIRDIYYLTDRDEIDARMQELIPFLQSHKDVNRSNYKWYIQDSTSYQFLQYLLSMRTYFQIEVLASDDIEQIGNFIKKLYKETNYHSDTNISPTETVNKLYKRYCESIIYAQHQFNKILFYMFEKSENGLNEHYHVIPKRIKRQTYNTPTKEDTITFKKIMVGFEIMNELYYSQFK